ncbi:DUF99 family protein [Oxyplasma meridianum]|uniref:UPF0215 protein OXIME_001499 n=1 Tax=Oxyplasma meridianum TaxID=3073602 RepID=A0AAX4NHK3_9ARCH
MKRFPRIVGVCGSPFNRDQNGNETLLFTLVRMDGRLEGVSRTSIEIDGTDSTNAIKAEILSRYIERSNYVMLPGITFGGFNFCDIAEINASTGLPILSLIKHKPDLDSIKHAVEKHTQDARKRIAILEKTEIIDLTMRNGYKIYANLAGINAREAELLVRKSTIFGKTPEPLRIGRMISEIV